MLHTSIGMIDGIARGQYYWLLDIGCLAWYRITFGRRAFSVAGPTVWNSLPTEFSDLSLGLDDFRRSLKTILFARY